MSPFSSPLELVFKSVDGLDLYADVYLPERASKDTQASVLLWWHGGGLLQGTRKGITPHLACAAQEHGICVVSADYRLAPQTRLPEILADCVDVIRFLRSDAFAAATGSVTDPQNKLIVSGSSAGGFLSLLVGNDIGFEEAKLERVKPPVKGIVAIYPITDLLDPFWTTKQRPVSYMEEVIPEERVAAYLDSAAEKTCFSAIDSPRSIFYHYMVQEGILSSLLLEGTGIPPSAFSVAPALEIQTSGVPPTYIIHGTVDDKVPARQSQDVDKVLSSRTGLIFEYEERQGLNHLFDRDEAEKMDGMYKFIKKICS
jgi:acetyl esterase/lipase